VDAVVFLARGNFRQMIALLIGIAGGLQDVTRAKLDAEVAALAARGDEIHLAVRYGHFPEVKWCSGEDPHCPLSDYLNGPPKYLFVFTCTQPMPESPSPDMLP
jgi:hypothetical protein